MDLKALMQDEAAARLSRALAVADLRKLTKAAGAARRAGLGGELVERAERAVEVCGSIREATEALVRACIAWH